jgi:hypothetical protein
VRGKASAPTHRDSNHEPAARRRSSERARALARCRLRWTYPRKRNAFIRRIWVRDGRVVDGDGGGLVPGGGARGSWVSAASGDSFEKELDKSVGSCGVGLVGCAPGRCPGRHRRFRTVAARAVE